MRILKKLPVVLLLIVALGMPQLAAAAERNRPSQEATQAYVVVFEEHVSTSAGRRAAEDAGGDVVNTYEGTFTGATVEMTPSEVERLRSDGRVKSVVEEPEFTIAAQTVPTGIRRVDTPGIDNNGPDLSSVHIAVLDTGIDLSHPDLNVGSGINCVNPSASPNDDHGHGTHVAGTIAAKDNNIGVVGVAPGAVVHPVKVLNSAGSSVSGSLGCGLQWVLNNASMIDVVNMSLGGSTSLRDEDNCGLSNGDAFHQWVCAIVNAGITVVVAAGNNNQTTTYKIPARYREAVTVSALADYDGLPGGLANSSDDKMASFSNFGSHVDVIAPGVSILSTTRGGSYGYMSGTSMAAPHAAGAAAAYIAQNGGASPAQVDGALKSTGTFDWTGDKDQWKEPLINVRQLLGGGSGGGGGATIDASVNQVAASPTTIALNGGNVTITATVGNNGTSSATIPVGVTGPNGYSSSQNVSVSAGATTQVSFSWPASVTGSHTFTVTTNLAGDQNSANNQGTSPTVTVSGSSSPTVVDAEVVSLKASSTSVSQGGSAVTFTANVRNNGTSSASIAVRLTSGSASVNTTKSVTLGAGKSTNVTFQWSPSVVGTHSFTATAVLANDSKPSNNSKSVNVTVNQQAAKHIYVSQTSATKTATGWRVTLTLGSSNGNVGAGATIKVSVRDQFGRTRAYTVKTQSNGSATFAVSLHTTSTHTLTITSITYSGHTYNAALNKGVPMTLTI